MKIKISWPVIAARVVAVAGLFVSGGAALGFVPAQYQQCAAAVAGIILAVASVLPAVHTAAKEAADSQGAEGN